VAGDAGGPGDAGDAGANVIHADLDAFYASVEQLLDPALRDRPIAVGGGVVLAASYQARAFGVGAGMPAWRARSLCPELVIVNGHFREYQHLGDAVMDVFSCFTPSVERISIDEAFLDVSGASRLFGAPTSIALEIRRRVREEIGLPLSVGVAQSKHLAKVASQVAKPDGMVVVAPGHEEEFLHDLPVSLIWGVGPATAARLASAGIHTVGQLAAVPDGFARHLVGERAGQRMAALANNVDPRKVGPARPASSMGAQAALGRQRATPELVRSTLGYLADRVASRMRAAKCAARTVTVRVRFPGLRSVTRSVTMPMPIDTTLTLTEVAGELAWTAISQERQIELSLLAISASHLVAHSVQLALPFAGGPPAPKVAARSQIDRAVDAARARFGRQAVGYAAVVFSSTPSVPEEFRELAERHAERAIDQSRAT